jgi:FkbM family methyltransferase
MMLTNFVSAFYRALPIKGGQTRLSFNKTINSLFAERRELVEAKVWGGARVMVDPHDYHGRILYLFGTNDIKVSLNANTFLRSGDVFLDIGANYSSIGLYAARAVGPAGAVHLFEPQSRIADPVAAAIAAGGFANVHLHRCGLLDVETTLTIRAPANHSGRATFAQHDMATDFESVEDCVVHEVGGYVGPLVAGRPFGVKIDIEGSEPRVMPWLLGQPNLKFIIFEANHNHRELFDLVAGSGLRLFGLERRALRLRLGRIDTLDDMLRYHDVIALRLKPGFEPQPSMHPAQLAPYLHDVA